MTRQVVVVDTETTGLGSGAVVLEIAAMNLETGEEFRVVPYVTRQQLATADPEALAINRYYERRVFADMLEDDAANNNAFAWLRTMLDGNTLAGVNPSFDSPLLVKLLGSRPHHYRLWDLSAYAAGALGLEDLPGLHKICKLLGVENEGEHSALGDVRATAECFRIVQAMNQDRLSCVER